jgi:regulator of cell morphogenesis and NO signaling
MNLSEYSRVGEIAAQFPLATRVFARRRIDYCCGGGVALEDACRRRGLDAREVLAEIEAELDRSPISGRSWCDVSSEALIDHIVETFHRPLHEELPRLDAMARKVATVHADRDRDGRLAELADTVARLRGELEIHMQEEEAELFPALLAGGSEDVASFEHEHEAAGAELAALRRLTDDFVPPAEACTTWRALFAGLEALESMMHEHVHLENNVLFPRYAGGSAES